MNEKEKVLTHLDIPYSYELAKRMEAYRCNPELGYRSAGSKAEFLTGEMLKKEMEEIVKICKEAGKISKVIFENCYLTDDEKVKVAEIAKEVKPDFIKTSTGFGTGGATVEDVKLMKSVVGDEVKVKAAGGIRDLKTALAMIEAGAERLGTSAGVAIVEEYMKQK